MNSEPKNKYLDILKNLNWELENYTQEQWDEFFDEAEEYLNDSQYVELEQYIMDGFEDEI